MAKWTKDVVADALHKLYARAATDKAFRDRCIADGREALREIVGDVPPAVLQVGFVEKSPEKATLVLPPYVGDRPLRADELKDLGPMMAACSTWSTLQPCKI